MCAFFRNRRFQLKRLVTNLGTVSVQARDLVSCQQALVARAGPARSYHLVVVFYSSRLRGAEKKCAKSQKSHESHPPPLSALPVSLCMRLCAHACACARASAPVRLGLCACARARAAVCARVCACVCACVCARARMCVRACAHVCATKYHCVSSHRKSLEMRCAHGCVNKSQ